MLLCFYEIIFKKGGQTISSWSITHDVEKNIRKQPLKRTSGKGAWFLKQIIETS